MEIEKTIGAIEAMLFVSGEPLSLSRLAKTLDMPEEGVKEALATLAEVYASDPGSGLMVSTVDDQVRLTTKPEFAGAVEALTKSTLQENLSRAALEVLSIIAYRAPITRAEIEAIRGVNCSFTLRNLLMRDLIEREDDGARSFRYRPTFKFLQSLGLGSRENLPDFQALSSDARMDMLLQATQNEEENIQ